MNAATLTTTDVAFLVLALWTLVGGYRVITSDKIMHAALWLGFSFFGVAGIFLVLNADFIAAAQVLVYIGAITTMLIFGIMLSNPEDLRGRAEMSFWQKTFRTLGSPSRGFLPMVAAVGFAGLMAIIFSSAQFGPAPTEIITDTPKAIGEALFTKYVIPFEIASVLLLVALVGAVVLAMREEDLQ